MDPVVADAQNALLAKAIAIASNAFKTKLDKGGQPYILHCLRVMAGVNQSDPQLMQAAVLHDLVEDCPEWSIERLGKEGFGYKVCGLIEMLTHQKPESYEEYIDRLSVNPLATQIKLADLRDNTNVTRLKGLTDKDFERMAKYHRAYVLLNS